MTYQIEFHDLVSEDYDEAYIRYSLIREELGERFAAAIRKRAKQISENPEHYGEKIVFVNSIHHEKMHPRKKYRK